MKITTIAYVHDNHSPPIDISTFKGYTDTPTEVIGIIQNSPLFPKIIMPCGETYGPIWETPPNDIPCPCGNKSHWLFKRHKC